MKKRNDEHTIKVPEPDIRIGQKLYLQLMPRRGDLEAAMTAGRLATNCDEGLTDHFMLDRLFDIEDEELIGMINNIRRREPE